MSKYKSSISLLCVFFVKMLAEPGAGDSSMATSYFIENEDISIPSDCTRVLQKFAESSSNFTLCAIQNARPIHVCEHCVSDYINFKNNYLAALNQVVNSTSNETTTCKSMLISNDKLEVVFTFYVNIQDVWRHANCDVCFDWVDDLPTTSNNTLHFYKLFNATKECIDNGKSNNSDHICETCMKEYIALDEYYQTLSGNGNDLENVCMDVIDIMNTTRTVWSGTLNCCRLRKHPEIVFLCCTGLISSLPLLFYVILRYFGQMRDLPKALKQTRFKQRFLAALQPRRQSS